MNRNQRCVGGQTGKGRELHQHEGEGKENGLECRGFPHTSPNHGEGWVSAGTGEEPVQNDTFYSAGTITVTRKIRGLRAGDTSKMWGEEKDGGFFLHDGIHWKVPVQSKSLSTASHLYSGENKGSSSS